MALKKKNVFQGFMQDDYVPSGDQQIVKYLFGKGNNLHEVECLNGTNFLVTMPKKFRQTVWLKKGDCLVIDPITEGKKVLGEIICVLPAKSVIELITSREWRPKQDITKEEENHNNSAGDGDGDRENFDEKRILEFYSSGCKSVSDTDSSCMPPSDSSSEGDDDDNESSEQEDDNQSINSTQCKGDVQVKIGSHLGGESISVPMTCSPGGESEKKQNSDVDIDTEPEEGFKSRVQFLTSGIVTNVVNDISSLDNDLQSLDFETEDSSLESNQQQQCVRTQQENHNNVHRKANTIRIQVNHPPDYSPDSNDISTNSNTFNSQNNGGYLRS